MGEIPNDVSPNIKTVITQIHIFEMQYQKRNSFTTEVVLSCSRLSMKMIFVNNLNTSVKDKLKFREQFTPKTIHRITTKRLTIFPQMEFLPGQ